MKVVKNLQVWAKVDRRWVNLKFEIRRCRIRVDRKRPKRPVFYFANFSGLLPFKIDIGGGVEVRPRVIMKVYHKAASSRERVRALVSSKEVQSP